MALPKEKNKLEITRIFIEILHGTEILLVFYPVVCRIESSKRYVFLAQISSNLLNNPDIKSP